LFPDEFQEIEQKKAVEEINNLYVAMTRAKTNMGVFWVYKEKDLVEEKNLKCKITRNAKEIAEAKPERYIGCSKLHTYWIASQARNDNQQPPTPSSLEGKDWVASQARNDNRYFDIPNKKLNVKLQSQFSRIPHEQLKNLYITKKSKLYGNATHTYLSYIKYDQPVEHNVANMQTLRLYGSIMTKSEIEEIVLKAKSFINKNKLYYDKVWNKVFNEFVIHDKNKRLYRIDRMMINTTDKEIFIMDYKTGEIEDSGQIEVYMKIVREMKVYRNEGYSVSGGYFLV
jgi:ATP-dependent exoDNAse (exonuclease V) beta subunit